MQILIKGVKGFEIYSSHKEYIEKRFRKFEQRVKEPAFLEFAFHHTHGTRANIDKRIHLTFTMAGMRKSEHLEELSEHFPETIDKLQKRFAKVLQQYRGKNIQSSRRPRKYYLAKKLQQESEEI